MRPKCHDLSGDWQKKEETASQVVLGASIKKNTTQGIVCIARVLSGRKMFEIIDI